MQFRQQGLSRTLPKNFTYPTTNSYYPQTPDRPPLQLDAPPPPPRHACSRSRRTPVRPEIDIFSCAEPPSSSSSFADIPLPSIEIPHHRDAQEAPSCAPTIPTTSGRFLALPRGRQAFRTPPAQIRPMSVDSSDIWQQQKLGNSILRPGSACSNASDSSASSVETFATPRSMGGSCTSPESDIHDPFLNLEPSRKTQVVEPQPPPSPLPPVQRFAKSLSKSERWSPEMDSHLWNTYQLYIQDPTMTPFKMTPGSIPPLGVTHRVARQAKRSWEKRRKFKSNWVNASQTTSSNLRRTRFANNRCRSTTPTAATGAAKHLWPNSEASTRRRLKLLCKRRFSIAPHYQRMLQSCSPEPFHDLLSRPSRESSCTGGAPMAYATRDLGVSLMSSTVTGPLSQLASGGQRDDEWFNDPVRDMSFPHDEAFESVPEKIFPTARDTDAVPPRLGSPFIYKTWGPNSCRRRVENRTPRPRRGTIHITSSQHQPSSLMRTYNTNTRSGFAQQDVSLEQGENTDQHLEEIVRQGKLDGMGQGCVRVRSRGATMNSAKSLNQLFSEPPPWAVADKLSGNSSSSSTEGNDAVKRLGSPFQVGEPPRLESSMKTVRHASSLSEPFAGLAAHLTPTREPAQQQAPEATSGIPYSSTEEGDSRDTERMRRQDLGYAF